MPRETILIVDDAPINLKLTDILLRKEGFQVLTATDAEQALAMLGSNRPDLILIDIQLPGMDGLELTRQLKQNRETRDIVLVALTACAMKGDAEKAFEAGCDGYITKPIDTMSLGARIRGYLAQGPSRRSAGMTRTSPGCAGS
ncbi:MAG TPA: response regulator [Bryobacteraceae bacterium]|nr:response regulator [Bryobacteraceae bacterium]